MLCTVLLPGVALYSISVAATVLLAAARRRRFAIAIAAALAAAIAGQACWGWMDDVRYEITEALLLWCCGRGWFVGRRIERDRPLRAQSPLIIGTSALTVMPCFFFLWLLWPWRMVDEPRMVVRSPDGAYTATLVLKDSIISSYQCLVLDTSVWRPFGGHREVTEVACYGLKTVSWPGPRTLVVDYDGTHHKNELDDILFVRQDRRWRDVQIVYRDASRLPAPPASGAASQPRPQTGNFVRPAGGNGSSHL